MAGRILLCLGLSLAAIGCGRAQGEEDVPDMPFTLSADEIGQARRLAEHHLGVEPRPMSPEDRIYFIKAELLPESQADSPRRQVMVIHYRYRDDETIHTMIDLVQNQILKVEKFHHFPTALAPEEIKRAEDLARRDERLRPLFEKQAVPVRMQVRPVDVGEPGQRSVGHRVVQVLLVQDDHYLREPRVLVDLHSESVVLGQ